MVNNNWFFDIENVVFTNIKVNATKKLKDKFPKINFTTSNRTQGSPIYPTVYIHENAGAEKGNDLENKTINAVESNIQIEVITDTSKDDAKKIASVCADIMKNMSFDITSLPVFEEGSSYYRLIMRCSRTFGNADL